MKHRITFKLEEKSFSASEIREFKIDSLSKDYSFISDFKYDIPNVGDKINLGEILNLVVRNKYYNIGNEYEVVIVVEQRR